jgi:hypothetical protein
MRGWFSWVPGCAWCARHWLGTVAAGTGSVGADGGWHAPRGSGMQTCACRKKILWVCRFHGVSFVALVEASVEPVATG